MTKPSLIVLAGATGNLGRRIARNLVKRGVAVRVLVRRDSSNDSLEELRSLGAEIVVVDYDRASDLAAACAGAACVVSALAGLREVVVDAQGKLLAGAVTAGVPRFIPSDYCIDFTKLPPNTNRNLDLRREFHTQLAAAPVAATSIFNGAFADMLTGQAPIILFKRHRVLYWGNANQLMDFTTIDNTAEFTAAAAIDPVTPRYLRIAGDQLSPAGLAAVASEVTGTRFRLFRAGGLGLLSVLIKSMRKLFPAKGELYPPWQGMQYLHNMSSGLAKLKPLDNGRYHDVNWTPVRTVLADYISGKD